MPDEKEIFITQKAHELDALFCDHAPIMQIEQFLHKYQENLIDIFEKTICCVNLFSTEFIASIDIPSIRIICMLLHEKSHFCYSTKMYYCAAIIMSNWISTPKKAMFWHVMIKLSCPPWYGVPNEFFAQDIFIDNEDVRNSLLYHQKKADDLADAAASRGDTNSFLYHQKNAKKRNFIKNTKQNKRFFLKDELAKGIREDSVSIFEMHRQMAGRKITITMLLVLLQFNAVKCFSYLLANFPKQVYKCRTAEEWLFTVCRDSSSDTAIPIIQRIEEDKPGIVANARDPWGNTLLWNTLVNRNRPAKLQEALISLGCDPEALNQWGLSFLVVKENKLN